MVDKMNEEIATSISGMMDTQPINLAGQEHPSKYEKQGRKREKKAQLGYKYKKIRSNSLVENISEEDFNEIYELALEYVDSLLEEKLTRADWGAMRRNSTKQVKALTKELKSDRKGIAKAVEERDKAWKSYEATKNEFNNKVAPKNSDVIKIVDKTAELETEDKKPAGAQNELTNSAIRNAHDNYEKADKALAAAWDKNDDTAKKLAKAKNAEEARAVQVKHSLEEGFAFDASSYQRMKETDPEGYHTIVKKVKNEKRKQKRRFLKRILGHYM